MGNALLVSWGTLLAHVPIASGWHERLAARVIGRQIYLVDSEAEDNEIMELPECWLPAGEITDEEYEELRVCEEHQWPDYDTDD